MREQRGAPLFALPVKPQAISYIPLDVLQSSNCLKVLLIGVPLFWWTGTQALSLYELSDRHLEGVDRSEFARKGDTYRHPAIRKKETITTTYDVT